MFAGRNGRRSFTLLIALTIIVSTTALTVACQSNPLTSLQLPITPSPVIAHLTTATITSTTITRVSTPNAVALSTPSPMAADSRLGESAQGLQGHLYCDNHSAIFIQWTETNNSLIGSLLLAQSDVKAQTGTHTTTYNFTGTRSGTHLSLTFPKGLGVSTNIAGEINEPLLILYFPDQDGTISPITLYPGNAAQFNDAVITLQQQVQQQAAQDQAAKATTAAYGKQEAATAGTVSSQQEKVGKANARLADALHQLAGHTNSLAQQSTFKSYLDSYASDWASMQMDDQELHQEAGRIPRNCSYLEVDLTHLTVDQTHIGVDRNNFTFANKQVSDDITTVRQVSESVQTAWAALQDAVNANSTGTPAPQFTQEDVIRAVTSAQQQIDQSTNALQNAQSQASDYDQKAADVVKNAKALVASMKCQ